MSLADGYRTNGAADHAALARDLRQLQHLIDVMQRHVPRDRIDERELALVSGPLSASTAEQHLRAIGTLLTTLETYVRSRRGRRPRRLTADGQSDRAAPPTRAPVAVPVAAPVAAPDVALAAAAARYIARDLAARSLSEFTSAEGYRLARTLAQIGDVEEPVERLLAEANTIRLHPAPLTDAVSHSAV